jgi:hypothetical protein
MPSESEFYILGNETSNKTRFVTCTILKESPYFFTWWTSGKPLSQRVEEPILYHVYDNSGPVEDFPFTNAGQFLVSEKLYKLLEQTGAKYDSYRSGILIEDTGERLENYYSINFIESYSVIDRAKSKFESDPDFPETDVRTIYDLVIKREKVPPGLGILKLRENQVVTIVTKQFKDKIVAAGITGVSFKPVKSS